MAQSDPSLRKAFGSSQNAPGSSEVRKSPTTIPVAADHNPEWCAWRPGATFQKPFSQSQPGECSLQNRIAGHSSIFIRATRIA
jgi:hypothetical protein